VKILGVSNAWDAGAALLVDGQIVAAANEERFTRIKLDRCFPEKAIEYVLSVGDLEINQIDFVASGCWKGVDPDATAPRLISDTADQIRESDDPERTTEIIEQRLEVSGRRDQEFRDELLLCLDRYGVEEGRIKFFDHHFTHAVSAWSPSGFDEALVLTADGRGDGRSVTLWKGSEAGLELIDMATELVSPGALYGFVTGYMGFVPDRHEGKVTGLAGYGRMSGAYDRLRAGYGFEADQGRLWSKIGSSYSPFASTELPDLTRELDYYSREDVAFGVQTLFEESLVGFLLNAIDRMGIQSTNLCLAGGCMGNVKLNYELRKIDQVDGVYVFPHMGDGGLALGAAMAIELESHFQRVRMETAYQGPSFTDLEVEQAVVDSGLQFETLEESAIAPVTAEFLEDGLIVGWFQQGMEVGPRALGGRSILAAATDQTINDSLNERLERTEFMPFAPATTDSLAPKCFLEWKADQIASQFMTMCYDTTPLLAERCPAVVHVDGTARPQVIFREHNPRYHDVIEFYATATGNPAVINTSFNHHEEPIVLSPQHALRSLVDGNVDVLVIGRCVVWPNR